MDHLIDVCRLAVAHHGRRRALKDSGVGAHAACGLGIEKDCIDVADLGDIGLLTGATYRPAYGKRRGPTCTAAACCASV
jgi:hypothetical protein